MIRAGVRGRVQMHLSFCAQRGRKERLLRRHQEQRLMCPCLCGLWAWGHLRAPFYPVGVSCPGQDPKFLQIPQNWEGLRVAHCMEGKSEAQREVWLAPHHMGVASRGTGIQVSVSQTQRQCLISKAWAWAWVEGR